MVEQLEYEGKEGQTRQEAIHVPVVGGGFATREVYRVVNVRTHPMLGQRATEGTLHRLEDGRVLACSYVYHDPDARMFVLVVPESNQHQMLAERAALLGRLAADPSAPVPLYVDRGDLVIGADGLRVYLETGRTVSQERAARADRIAGEMERLDALRREIEMRETELEARFATLREREAALAELPSETTSPGDDEREDLIDSVQLMDEGESLVDSVEALDAAPSLGAFDADPEDVDLLHAPVPTDRELIDAVEDDLAGDVEALEPDDLEEVSPEEVVSLGDEELDDALEDDVEGEDAADLEDLDDLEGHVQDLDVGETVIRPSDQPDAPKRKSILPTPATPPDTFYSDPQIEMVAGMADHPWLFARLSEGHENAFRGDDVELLVQYMLVETYPVVLLTLVEWSDERPYVRRAALDPLKKRDRDLLDQLLEDFAVTIALFGPEGRFERSLEVSALARKHNLELALEQADRADAEGDPATALERALAAPPPVKLRGHPFELSDRAADAHAAFANVASLAKWSAPAKLDMALLALSIPRTVVDDAFRRILSDALTHGIALPRILMSRAVSLGVAAEPGELVRKQLAAFAKTAALADRGGLSPEVTVRNWEQLLEAAEELELPLEPDVSEAAWAAKSKLSGGAEPSVEPSDLEQMGVEGLVDLLEHPKLRREAALRLLDKGDAELLAPIYKAVRKMPRDEVLEIAPRVTRFGEAAADVLIDGLNARKTFVRQASALALGELKLRRSIAPLVQLLQTEPTEVWWEVARVLGEYGGGIVRTLTRAMRDPKGPRDRFAYTLAHLAHRAPDKVKQLETDKHDLVRAIAIEVMTQRDLVETHRKAARDPDPGDDPQEVPVFSFSRRFYAALEAI